MALSKSFRVYHKLDPPYSVILESRNREETLMFESGAVAVLSAVETESVKKLYSRIADAYGCLGVLSLATGSGDEVCLFLVLVIGCLSVGKINETDIFQITSTSFISLRNSPQDEDLISDMRKFLNSGSFYFSWSASQGKFDLSLCAQRYMSMTQITDNRFFWNRSLHLHLKRFNIDCNDWLLKIVCGGVEIRTIYAAQRQGKACLISRLSSERAGTRFNVRGVNDFGHVANFVETEQVIYIDDQVCSFIQTRGSVPLFWEQPGFQVGSHKVKMSRGFEASAPAFERHLTLQKQQYGQQVLVNLLGRKEGEHNLSDAFHKTHKASSHSQDVPYIAFDYHSECRGGNMKNLTKLKDLLKKYIDEFNFFHCTDGDITRQQTGTIRTNCLDCLDRTNAVQNMIGLEVLPEQLECLGVSGAGKTQMISRFIEVYKQMWMRNGDHVSRIYTGTEALGGGRSKAKDAATSATRTIQNNFLDSDKQDAIDSLLFGGGLKMDMRDKALTLLDPSSLYMPADVVKAMVMSYKDYSNPVKLRVSVGTWNVNGGKHFRSIAHKHEHIQNWLLDLPKIIMENSPEMIDPDVDFDVPVDIFAIGFEEIVDLNASNIVSASSNNQKEWGKYLQDNLSRDHKYVLLTTQQLVGVCLYIFIRPMLAPHIRDVAAVAVKTGLGGAAGNKGAIAVRFVMYNTSLCFVCSHFAAGQSNVKERNNDFHEIANKITFPMNRKVWHHDYLFWCGDFNYRIDLSKDEVVKLINDRNFTALQECDQLNVQRKSGHVFHGFQEGPTDFIPTYKYDLFCNDFDTSEKCRVPAWTDRVLWRRKPINTTAYTELPEEEVDHGRLLLYNRAELKTSDHRPVMALIEIEALQCDDNRRNATLRRIVDQLGPPDATVVLELLTGDEFTDELIGELIDVFGEFGDIILVRFVDSYMLLTYRSSQHALAVVTESAECQVGGQDVRASLLTPDWHKRIEQELSIVKFNTSAMYATVTNSLLGEDFSIPSMSFDLDDDEDDEVSGLTEGDTGEPGGVGIGGRRSPMIRGTRSPRSQSPARPENQAAVAPATLGQFINSPSHHSSRPSPGPSPKLSPSHHTPAARSVTTPDDPGSLTDADEAVIVIEDVEFGAEKSDKPKPPRPAALPSRPPPPVRPSPPVTSSLAPSAGQAPSRPAATPSPTTVPSVKRSPQHTVVARQPLRPHMNPSRKSQKQSVREIGLPTDVRRTQAKTADEAKQLIEKLLSGSTDQTVPVQPQAVSSDKSSGAGPVPVSRPRPSNQLEPCRPAPPRPQAMPRAKSAYNVNDGNAGSNAPTAAVAAAGGVPAAIPRNRSETNFEQRSDITCSDPFSDDLWKTAVVGGNLSGSASNLQLTTTTKHPSLPSLHSFETAESVEVGDAEDVSLPPPQTLPPSLPANLINRGPPPPVPSARPAGTLPPPLPASRPLPDPVVAPPIPGPRPSPVLPAVAPNQQEAAGAVLDNEFDTSPSADDGGNDQPFIPPRPKVMPGGSPPSEPPPYGPPPNLPPPIPSRVGPPPIPTRTPAGIPPIPPRQGTGS